MGKLVVNFQSLEFALRAFLSNHESGWRQQGDPTFLENIKEGDLVKENAFTNWDSLGKLIEDYNKLVGSTNPEFSVDAELKKTRDALAKYQDAAAKYREGGASKRLKGLDKKIRKA